MQELVQVRERPDVTRDTNRVDDAGVDDDKKHRGQRGTNQIKVRRKTHYTRLIDIEESIGIESSPSRKRYNTKKKLMTAGQRDVSDVNGRGGRHFAG